MREGRGRRVAAQATRSASQQRTSCRRDCTPTSTLAHEKPPSLAGFNGLRSLDQTLVEPSLCALFVLPGHSVELLRRPSAGMHPSGFDHLKPSKPASEGGFSCARLPSSRRTPRTREPQSAQEARSRAADINVGHRRRRASPESNSRCGREARRPAGIEKIQAAVSFARAARPGSPRRRPPCPSHLKKRPACAGRFRQTVW